MKTVTIYMTWTNSVDVEVPDNFEMPHSLDGFPEDVLEQMDSTGVELTDWGLSPSTIVQV